MKILILSNTAWNNNNSFGNSYSNIFSGIADIEIANIYCRYGSPNNTIVSKYYQITEKMLINNLFNKDKLPGHEICNSKDMNTLSHKEQEIFNYARKKRFIIFYWIRNIIWKFGNWKSDSLKKFIKEFNPDIIFQPIYYSMYLNDICLFIKDILSCPMVGYVSDDVYTLKQYSLSPFFWVNRIFIRRKIRKVIKKCSLLYVVSDIQKEDYDKEFNITSKILTKGASFQVKFKPVKDIGRVMKFVFTGNIGTGRWEVLCSIGEALDKINFGVHKAELYIYTNTPFSNRMKKRFKRVRSIILMGFVESSEITEIQRSSDILLHVESFSLRNRLEVRQSFSTKIIDYLEIGKCIVAVGPKNIASMKYLHDNDGAVVITNKDNIYKDFKYLINNKKLIKEYGEKAWECGKKNHSITSIQKTLINDLDQVINEYSSNKRC